ncbi:septation protein SepH [Bifidobacterium tsurumiense]|uniref:septation protein SepH n=2 Tax=Bifidobacterium tsurumiense TaxID=356829 RepID=UPI0004148FDF|nr:septation protein SepH [Bifidobacterium tsurumiense]MSS12120.1 DUF3071 domain-containing protein [Bifidobacterium tsurumiense]
MPENPLNEAKFERVGDSGELVFSLGNAQFVVRVDDTLEHAILEAKQLKAENQRYSQAQPTHSLPISQIQALIRVGAEPAQVAEKYGLSETLVRRFSAAVETEKQYAITQFFTVPAPKESRVRTVAELVERTLAAARIGMESVSWKATRRGLEPWKITAQFESAGRPVRAEWYWDMHNNAITSLNNAARKLLGERDNAELPATTNNALMTSTERDAEFNVGSVSIPGDSVRSARIERAVSAWRATDRSTEQAAASAASNASPNTAAPAAEGVQSQQNPTSSTTATNPLTPRSLRVGTSAQRQDGSQAEQVTSAQSLPAMPAMPQPTSSEPGTEHSTDAAQSEHAPNDPALVKPNKRKGRSAVPSWDEILFGD